MDYSKKSFIFKFKKVARYIKLYGFSRTYIKCISQLHLKKEYQNISSQSKKIRDRQIIGIIGCGNYAFSNIAYFLKKSYGPVIASCMDCNINRARSLSEYYGAPIFTDNAKEVIGNENVKLIYIASNHSTHASYAIEALKAGKSVYIEKPHVVSEEQLIHLCNAVDNSQGRVFLGFNRPSSRFAKIMMNELTQQEGSGTYQWFVVGHDIEPEHWYLNDEEGGRVLGNFCHWTDFLLHIIPSTAYPIKIIPVTNNLQHSEIIVAYSFNDGSTGVITFSSQKGDPFEGVKERFCARKGQCIITLDDFEKLTIEVGDKRKYYRNPYRDHGHRDNILRAYENIEKNLPYDRDWWRQYIWNTGWLFLKTRESLEKGQGLMINSYNESRIT